MYLKSDITVQFIGVMVGLDCAECVDEEGVSALA